FDRPASHRYWQRQHPGGPAEAYRRGVDHPPAPAVDLYRPPRFVAQVEGDSTVQSADPKVDDAFGGVAMRLCFDHVERRLQRLGIWRAIGLLEESAGEPAAKALGADRPGFAMTVDIEVHETGAVSGVE